MISTTSSPIANSAISNVVQQLATAHPVPSSSSSGSSVREDTVQLSAETQQHLANSSATSAKQQPSFEQIVREAADGDISALAKLALIA